MAPAPDIETIDVTIFKGLQAEVADTYTIEMTVITGFEEIAAEEFVEKLGVTPVQAKGRIFADLNATQVSETFKLRSVEHIRVVIAMVPNFEFPADRVACFKRLYKFVEKPDWRRGISIWQRFTGYSGCDPFLNVRPIRHDFCTPRPDIDFRILKKTSPIIANLPSDTVKKYVFKLKLEDSGQEVKHECINNKNSSHSEENDLLLNKIGEKRLKTDTAEHDSQRTSVEGIQKYEEVKSGRVEALEGETALNPQQSEERTTEAQPFEQSHLNLSGNFGDSQQPEETTVNTQAVATGPKFRVTCVRSGSIHNFVSQEGARQFGGGVNDMFGWPVDLSNYDLEVELHISNNFVYVALPFTTTPMFKRNIVSFGPTSLKSTVCYNMIRMAKPQCGEIVIDPMCGGCSIPIESSLAYPYIFNLGGDNHHRAIARSHTNICHLVDEKKKSMAIDVAQWNVQRLPLRDQTVDIVVSDVPFGKRMGSRRMNQKLYFMALLELGRVTRAGTGRAVLLTNDFVNLSKNIRNLRSLWKNTSIRMINLGGLTAGVFVLQRTSTLAVPDIYRKAGDIKNKMDSDQLEADG